MPGSSTVDHPSGKRTLTFTESDHVYRDDLGQRYTSGTAAVKRCFAPFDAESVSARVAARDGGSASEQRERAAALREQWRAKGAAACEFGTRTHENCEAQLVGRALPNAPRDDREQQIMTAAYYAANDLLTQYKTIAVEMIVFSPGCYVAGTIDALMQHRSTGEYLIADWKTNEKLRDTAFNGAMGVGPCASLPDCDMSRYALQLSLYQRILTSEGYVPADATVHRQLMHLRPTGCVAMPMQYLRAESAEVMLNAAMAANNEVPF
jgi:hypothetical protein